MSQHERTSTLPINTYHTARCAACDRLLPTRGAVCVVCNDADLFQNSNLTHDKFYFANKNEQVHCENERSEYRQQLN